MRVLLSGEGTYPVVRGGVSTWCDQLVRGLPQIQFSVAVLTSGRTAHVYELPPNVRTVLTTEMWAGSPRNARIKRSHRATFLEAWEVIFAHAQDPTQCSSRAALEAWTQVARRDIAERIWPLANERAAISILASTRARAGLPIGRTRDLAQAMTYIARLVMPLSTPPHEVDLVHATSSGSSVLASLPTLQTGVPLLLSEHGVFIRERMVALRETDWSFVQRQTVTAFLRGLVQIGYEASRLIAPVSNFNGNWAASLGARRAKIATVYNGVDIDRFRPRSAEPREPILAFVGRIDPLKDLETMLMATALIREQVPAIQLHIIGPVPRTNQAYAQSLHDTTTALGLEDNVRFLGSTNDPVAAYSSGQIAALSSVSEGFPYGALEPMACGRPIVATAVGGVPEAVGHAGMLVAARDPRAFADACILLLDDPSERARLAQIGRARVEQEFSLDRMLGRFRSLYQELATAKPHRAGRDALLDLTHGTPTSARSGRVLDLTESDDAYSSALAPTSENLTDSSARSMLPRQSKGPNYDRRDAVRQVVEGDPDELDL